VAAPSRSRCDFSQKEAKLEIDGKVVQVRIDDIAGDARPRIVRSVPKTVAPTGGSAPARPSGATPPVAAAAGSITAPIPAMILAVLVTEGQEVAAGHPLLKMEAMKMETVVSAPSAGTVSAILIKAGDSVTQGQQLMVIE
jgi:glutaconyl-CoA/methylmalonyl-CoA decarboxylase subunit gamma